MGKIYFFILTVIFVSPALGKDASLVPSWDAFQQAYASYLKNPSPENVERICGLNPDRKEEKSRARVVDYMMDNLSILEKRVKNGDKPSIRLAFRLRNMGGGGEFDEDLDILLDTLIHSNPELFLDGLKENQGWIVGNKDLSHLLTFMGSEFTDQEGQPWKEYKYRIRTLGKVENRDLRTIRDECVKVLSGEIRNKD